MCLVQPRSVSVCVSSEDWVVRRAASFFDWSSFGDSRNWRVDTFIQRSRELLVERESCPCRRHLTERYAGRTIAALHRSIISNRLRPMFPPSSSQDGRRATTCHRASRRKGSALVSRTVTSVAKTLRLRCRSKRRNGLFAWPCKAGSRADLC